MPESMFLSFTLSISYVVKDFRAFRTLNRYSLFKHPRNKRMKGRKSSNFASLFVALVAIIGGIYAADMTLAKFKFVGYRNVWHE